MTWEWVWFTGAGLTLWVVGTAAIVGPFRHPRRFGQLLVVGVLLTASLLATGAVQQRMQDLRVRYKLVEAAPVENAPGLMPVFTVALGGFRGLLADVLFLRAREMQDQRNYYELVYIGELLVDLQPRFTAAAAFIAWNMAYNISVECNSAEERWRWVQRGIELLRDKAMPVNPDDPLLYKELGWIYQHKLGHYLDDRNRYYKTQLAKQMIRVLGNHFRFDWDRLAAAPRDETELQPALGDRWARLGDVLAQHQISLRALEHDFQVRGDFPEALGAALAAAGLREDLDFYFRARWLREEKKLDARLVKTLIDRHGYLDFRLPDAHAIYWASLGLTHADNNAQVDCNRMVEQCLISAFKYGRLLFLAAGDERPIIGPNLPLAAAAKAAVQKAMRDHPDINSWPAGWENFMKDAIVLLYTGAKRDEAASFLKELAEAFPTKTEYRQNIDEFALNELAKDIADQSMKQIESILVQMLWSAVNALAEGEEDYAGELEQIAGRIRDRYMQERITEKDFKRDRPQERVGLEPLSRYRRVAINLYISADPENMVPFDLRRRVRAYYGLPLTGELTVDPDSIIGRLAPAEVKIQRN